MAQELEEKAITETSRRVLCTDAPFLLLGEHGKSKLFRYNYFHLRLNRKQNNLGYAKREKLGGVVAFYSRPSVFIWRWQRGA